MRDMNLSPSRSNPTRVWIGAGAVILAIIALVTYEVLQFGAGQTQPTVIHLDASWAKGYSTVAALKQDADLAVDGTISRTIAVTRDSKGLVFTDFALSVQAVAFNPRQTSVSREITIHQTGGIVGSSRYEVLDDPLFESGEHVVLFLQQYSAGHFFVIGGPTGRFTVRNGVVSPMSYDGVKLGVQTTEADFLASIRI